MSKAQHRALFIITPTPTQSTVMGVLAAAITSLATGSACLKLLGLSLTTTPDMPSQNKQGELCSLVCDGLTCICTGGAIGYLGMASCYSALDVVGGSLKVRRSKAKSQIHDREVISQRFSAEHNTIAGRWVLDLDRSESLEPFLVAVGAPKLVAKLVGKKGKPMELRFSGNHDEVTIQVDGKEAEILSFATSTRVSTPRGDVLARAEGGPHKVFTVTKTGPGPDEVVTEVRELLDNGRTLKVTFSHRTGATAPVVVTRFYQRADADA